ncbi:MAG: hypothetical protein AB1298_02395 [Bacteroidota bacterium]
MFDDGVKALSPSLISSHIVAMPKEWADKLLQLVLILSIPQTSFVTLKVYDILSREIAIPHSGINE